MTVADEAGRLQLVPSQTLGHSSEQDLKRETGVLTDLRFNFALSQPRSDLLFPLLLQLFF